MSSSNLSTRQVGGVGELVARGVERVLLVRLEVLAEGPHPHGLVRLRVGQLLVPRRGVGRELRLVLRGEHVDLHADGVPPALVEVPARHGGPLLVCALRGALRRGLVLLRDGHGEPGLRLALGPDLLEVPLEDRRLGLDVLLVQQLRLLERLHPLLLELRGRCSPTLPPPPSRPPRVQQRSLPTGSSSTGSTSRECSSACAASSAALFFCASSMCSCMARACPPQRGWGLDLVLARVMIRSSKRSAARRLFTP